MTAHNYVLPPLQVFKLLTNSTQRWGEVQWAEVGDVPCRKDGGAAGCCSTRFSFRYGSTDYLVYRQVRWGVVLPFFWLVEKRLHRPDV